VITGGGLNGDEVLLEDRPWTGQPFCVGVPTFDTDHWAGISLFDRLRQIQDAKTDLERQMLLTGWRNLLQRIWGLEGAYDPDDLESSVRGGTVRVTSPQALGALPDVQLSPVSFSLLQTLDQVRRESGGGAIDAAAFAQQIGGDTAHGVERMMSNIEQPGALVARNIAETLFKPVYVKLHALLRDNWKGVLQARQSGQWAVQMPSQWTSREDVAVAVGISAFDRRSLAGAVAQVQAQQQLAIQGGLDGVLVGNPQLHCAATDFARLMGLPAPEQYWIDPESPEAQQALKQKQEQAAAQQEQMAAAAKAQGEMALAIENVRADARRNDTEWDHVAQVNDDMVKLVELAAKYTAEDISDLPQFQRALATAKGRRVGKAADLGPTESNEG